MTKSLEKMGGINQIFEFYCNFFTKYFRELSEKAKKLALFLNFLALFSENLNKKRARDKKFGKNGGINQIFEFYCIFINKYFQILGKNAKFLALFPKYFSVV